MAVLKNKTQRNFTMISNNILRDKDLSMKDRGVLCTICSLPDGWDFSIAGLSAIVPDGIDSIRQSVIHLEEYGYIERTKTRGPDGKFISEIEVFSERRTPKNSPCGKSRDGKSNTVNPSRINRHGSSVTDNPSEYNTDNIKKTINTDNNKSIIHTTEEPVIDRKKEISAYKKLIADNIKLDWLLDVAGRQSEAETTMVHEIYDVICDMVCYPRESVVIKNTTYPWEVVKSQFLKLRYEHIGGILNRLVDKDLGIKNMSSYLISTLYSASLVGTLEAQANLHDDYLKFLRGNPY
ncbi:MAG: helix-turn-helix domain-containing protein [Lachnospiraceae bacterium]|nr:helix-turn-helix domain-containing protein [Lachnospiraceae bacterium]